MKFYGSACGTFLTLKNARAAFFPERFVPWDWFVLPEADDKACAAGNEEKWIIRMRE